MQEKNKNNFTNHVPVGMQVAASWAWRLIVIGVAVAAVIWLVTQISMIVVPVLIAILLAALLQPIVTWATRAGLPRGVGVLLAIIVLLAAVTFLMWLISTQVTKGYSDLLQRSEQLWRETLVFLAESPLHIDVSKLEFSVNEIFRAIESQQDRIWRGALGVASSFASFFTGAILALFSLIFFLLDGRRIWYWLLGFLPAKTHAAVNCAGLSGWVAIGQYVRVQILVAVIDAIGIALGAWALGLPLVIPIGLMVFLGSFIPFMGAIVTGGVATLIALVYSGPTAALIMLGVVLLVQQIEGNILQPLVMGSAVKVHPLGVVLAVSTGALIAGIPGALFAVPIAASANAVVNTLVQGAWRGLPDPLPAYHELEKEKQAQKRQRRRWSRLRNTNAEAVSAAAQPQAPAAHDAAANMHGVSADEENADAK